jgi:hypothetical protein
MPWAAPVMMLTFPSSLFIDFVTQVDIKYGGSHHGGEGCARRYCAACVWLETDTQSRDLAKPQVSTRIADCFKVNTQPDGAGTYPGASIFSKKGLQPP